MFTKKPAIILLLSALAFGLHVRAQRAYINKVYEYRPAPGQFCNVFPTYVEGDTEADIIAKVEEQIVGKVGSSNYICLGAWGGYVTFGFDHPLVNVEGEYDLLVYGNAFTSGAPTDGVQYGSPEPGIVYVSQDENGDGLPNDTWYELAGSMASQAQHQYCVTYTFTGATENILWEDNMGASGSINRNIFHQQPYYPLWHADSTLTLTGTLLPSNLTASGSAFMFAYGYADNWPNSDERARLKLDWAIDAEGQPVKLGYVDFVRVQTGVLADWGIKGEISTEVCGAEDLHPDAPLPLEDALNETSATKPCEKILYNGQLHIRLGNHTYDCLGRRYWDK